MRSTGGGRCEAQGLFAGRFTISVGVAGYGDVEFGERLLVLGETIDLGAVALEPLELFRIRVLATDGTPVPAGTQVIVG